MKKLFFILVLGTSIGIAQLVQKTSCNIKALQNYIQDVLVSHVKE